MDRLAGLRPRRSLVLPVLVVAVPALYAVYRDAAMGCPPARPCLGAAHAGWALASVAGAYLLASAALALVDEGALADASPAARLALRPTDGTLAVLAAFAVGIAAYLLASLVAAVPAWLDPALTPVGLVLGLPAVLGYAAMVAVANAVLSEPPTWVQWVVVAASLALTAVWLFALATGLAQLLGSRVPALVGSR